MEQDVDPKVCSVPVVPGDRFLLCTDGLWNALPDKRMAKLMTDNTGPAVICANLITAAKAVGGQDNITCVAVSCEEPRVKSSINDKLVYSVVRCTK